EGVDIEESDSHRRPVGKFKTIAHKHTAGFQPPILQRIAGDDVIDFFMIKVGSALKIQVIVLRSK
ncbi:hypothetical protein ACQWF9_25650, partial [Salmonella enterica subsp. enterica serovar Infantis]